MDSDEVDENGQTSVTPPAQREDVTALLAAAKAGDASARTRLLTELMPTIRRFLTASGFGYAGGEPIILAVASDLFRELDRFDDEETLLNWLMSAVLRKRTQAALSDYVPDPQQRALVTGPEPRLTRREQQLLRAMATNESYQAIADELGIPVGSVGPTRMRLLQKLRQSPETVSPIEPRANLEAALRAHLSAPESPAPRRGLRRFLGLTTPAPPEVRPGDRTIAAVRDVTGAGRDVLRELDEVLTITRESEDRT
ncbi:LuxR C-terminal-related transcriptional regulator [Amycolatopsis sp. NBC_01307]|uniref:LuxR C-terminal-related transcriptional regulator n=1 Tax=Amycolatopsis sp. NBC_01307 TaxID=2903561 RepID=UPI002E146958|nr:LuxR C-terminal-related transcriptional regulator [Amycolatopsis sp. NBC_01307]